MKKNLIIGVVSILFLTSMSVFSPEKEYSEYETAMWALKSHESLTLTAYWDVNRWSIGWGTISHKGEVITRQEADRRVKAEFERVYNNITERYPHLTRWQRLVLSITDYNVGNFGKSLNEAIATGDSKKIAKVMKRYVYTAKGKDGKRKKLKGLVKRRNEEAKLLTSGNNRRQRFARKFKKRVSNLLKRNK